MPVAGEKKKAPPILLDQITAYNTRTPPYFGCCLQPPTHQFRIFFTIATMQRFLHGTTVAICGVAVLFATAVATAVEEGTIRQYRGSAGVLSNPDRGFRTEFGNGIPGRHDLCHEDGPSAVDLADAAKYNLTIAQAYCFLPAGPVLTDVFLARVNASFAILRRHGVKALLRFLYDHKMPGENNYTFSTIAGHIDQLAPVVKANADMVYVLQAGFIGSWGEWHNSMQPLLSNATGVQDMLRRELYTLLPPDRKIQVRN